jgi:flagellar motor switch protein FliN/FliY
LPELQPGAPLGPELVGAHTGLLDSVKVSLSVMLGETHLTLGELMSLKEAAVLKVDRMVDAPVDVVINGNVVARGQLVVVDDNFGVRVTEIAARLD